MSLTLPMLEAEARRVAGEIGASLPEGVGFTVLLFNFTETPDDPDNFITYLSSGDRETMKQTLRELLAKWDADGVAMAPTKVAGKKPRRKWKFGR